MTGERSDIQGAEKLIERFGAWPNFHDSEVMSIVLERHSGDPCAELLLHAWQKSSEIDGGGAYVLKCHTLVRFRLEGIVESELSGFNNQNVLFDLLFEQIDNNGMPGVRVSLESSYGLGGSMTCRQVIIVDVEPCDPFGRSLE